MLNRIMLLGLAGLALPVIIHLIHRQRLRPRMLATIQFLDPQDVSNAFAPVPRHWLQLLLRLLLMAVLVLLMARLFVTRDQVGPRTLAVVLDRSMSMQRIATGGERTLFDECKQQIGELIDTLREGDRMALMLVGDTVAHDTGFTEDPDVLRAALASFEVSDAGDRALVPAVRGAARQLVNRREVNTCVIVFSDHQRSTYEAYAQGDDDAKDAAWRQVPMLLVSAGDEPGPNVAVTDASFSPATVHLGQSATVSATLKNLAEEQRSVDVTLYENDRQGAVRQVVLEPGEQVVLDLEHRFDSPVDTATRVELNDDALRADNHYFDPMRMKQRTNVLLVAPGEDGAAGAFSGVDLLSYALNPGDWLAGARTGTHVALRRVTPNVLRQQTLPMYSTVMLYGIDALPADEIEDLLAFVSQGGGLVIIPTAEVNPVRFNDSFAPLLGDLALGTLRNGETTTTIDSRETAVGDDMLAPMLRGEWGGIAELSVSAYFALQQTGAARDVLRTTEGDWLAATAAVGRGRVYVQLFSCELTDSSVPRSSVFVPMVQRIITSLSQRADDTQADTLRAGETAWLSLPEYRSLGGSVALRGPVEHAFEMSEDDQGVIAVRDVVRAGNYRIEHDAKQTGRSRWLGVNPVAGESDLAAAEDATIARALGDGAQRLAFADLGARFSRGHELFAWLVMLLLGAFVIEALAGAWQARRSRRVS